MDAAFDEVYVAAMGRPGFPLQHVVDAHHAQTSTSMREVWFGLVGLHLHLDRGLDGRTVQQAHRAMGERGGDWPALELPADRGAVTAADVAAGASIDEWCRSVWAAFDDVRDAVIAVAAEHR